MRCKICCGCEHGRLRGQCRECGGSSSFSASTGGSATAATARSVAAAASASTGGSAASARSVAAVASASTGARATTATVECGGSSICEHGRLCTTCMKECSGTAIHKHRRQRGLYEHRLLLRRQRSWCRIVAAAASFPWRRQRRKSSTGTRGLPCTRIFENSKKNLQCGAVEAENLKIPGLTPPDPRIPIEKS